MTNEAHRYLVCDENRRTPIDVDAPSDGTEECGRFDDLHEALRVARDLWDGSEHRHRVVVRDGKDGDRVVWAGDEIDVTPID
jgi:hypothetical protein